MDTTQLNSMKNKWNAGMNKLGRRNIEQVVLISANGQVNIVNKDYVCRDLQKTEEKNLPK